MNLEILAERLVGTAAKAAVMQWMEELRSAVGGPVAVRHLDGEENLAEHHEGREAIRRLVEVIAVRSIGTGVSGYLAAIRDLDLACKGPQAANDLPDELCKVARGWTVWNRLRKVSAPDDTPVMPPGSPRLADWLRDIVCSPAYLEALDPGRPMSGKVPAVFSAFQEDRRVRFPAGTAAAHCWQIVGADPPKRPEPCVLLKYVRSEVGPARVPSAFDAGNHPHFLPARVGAGCGLTKNLRPHDGRDGVREVVVPPFPVAKLREPEFIGT